MTRMARKQTSREARLRCSRWWSIIALLAAISLASSMLVPRGPAGRNHATMFPPGTRVCSGENATLVLEWATYHGSSLDDSPGAIWIGADGSVFAWNAIKGIPKLAKFNGSTGTVVWERPWSSGFPNEYTSEIDICGDSTYIYGCSLVWDEYGHEQMQVIKWSQANGDLAWNYTRRVWASEEVYSIWTDGLGGVYTTGWMMNLTTLIWSPFTIKWNASDGSMIWRREFGSSHIIGDEAGFLYALPYKFTADGDLVWNKKLTCNETGFVTSDVWIDSDGYLYVLMRGSDISHQNRYIMAKWDEDGNLIWNRTHDNDHIPQATYTEAISLSGNGDGLVSVFGHMVGLFTSNTTTKVPFLSSWDSDGNFLGDVTWDQSYYASTRDGTTFGDSHFLLSHARAVEGVRTDILLIKWSPNAAPAISRPDDIFYPHQTTGHSITWVITDSTVQDTHYEIRRNGTLVGSGSWTSGGAITRPVDGLGMGSYNYTIVASDGHGATVNDTVIVTVTNAPPSITHPPDVTYPHQTTGHAITWQVFDASRGTTSYTIYRDGAPVHSGTWASGGSIVHDVDNLDVGIYNFTLVAWDGLGASGQDSVNVTVQNVAPVLDQPADRSYTRGSTGNYISWTITDGSTGARNCTVLANGSVLCSGTWTPGIPKAIDIDGFGVGTYNVTIIVFDGLGGTASDTVIVTVTEAITTRPGISDYLAGVISAASLGALVSLSTIAIRKIKKKTINSSTRRVSS